MSNVGACFGKQLFEGTLDVTCSVLSQVLVLMDGASFSMSAYVASQLVMREQTEFLGVPSGGGWEGSNAVLPFSPSVLFTKFSSDHKRYSRNQTKKIKTLLCSSPFETVHSPSTLTGTQAM